MKLTEEQKKGRAFFQELISKAWEDENFKKELIDNPIMVLTKLSGKDFTSFDKKIIVTDQSDPESLYINIPVQSSLENAELSEEQLEAISGGADPFPPYSELDLIWLINVLF